MISVRSLKIGIGLCAALIAAGIFVSLLLPRVSKNRETDSAVIFAERSAMNTFLRLWIDSGCDRECAMKTCSAAVDRVSASLSVFNKSGVTAKINAAAGTGIFTKTDTYFDAVLSLAVKHFNASGGAFNPAVGPLMELWGFARGGEPKVSAPTAEEIEAAIKLADIDKISGIGAGSISLTEHGMKLDFGAIAKGYGADVAYNALLAAGITNFIVDIGGNMRFSGKCPKTGGKWIAAVRNPLTGPEAAPIAELCFESGEAVSTSGSYERFTLRNGRRCSHIMDPRTGRPVDTDLLQVTVMADTAADADALSTSCFVLGPEAGSELLDYFGAHGLFVVSDSENGLKLVWTAGAKEKYSRSEN